MRKKNWKEYNLIIIGTLLTSESSNCHSIRWVKQRPLQLIFGWVAHALSHFLWKTSFFRQTNPTQKQQQHKSCHFGIILLEYILGKHIRQQLTSKLEEALTPALVHWFPFVNRHPQGVWLLESYFPNGDLPSRRIKLGTMSVCYHRPIAVNINEVLKTGEPQPRSQYRRVD